MKNQTDTSSGFVLILLAMGIMGLMVAVRDNSINDNDKMLTPTYGSEPVRFNEEILPTRGILIARIDNPGWQFSYRSDHPVSLVILGANRTYSFSSDGISNGYEVTGIGGSEIRVHNWTGPSDISYVEYYR